MEYSLGCREIEDDVLPCARTLGVSIIAYSPLARGLLAGVKLSQLPPGDWRLSVPRHNDDNMAGNEPLISAVEAMALSKGCTPAQIAIAWLLSQGNDIIPLVGTKTVARLKENALAVSVTLTDSERAQLSALPPLKVRAPSPLAIVQRRPQY
jgi:aryl-alcohol dehydrogenase-like predicted oxidoreductase